MALLRRLLLLVGVAAGLLALTPGPAAACSCAAEPFDAGLARADAAVVATLLERGEPEPERDAQGRAVFSSGAPVDLVFRVDKIAKGDVPERLVVTTAALGASCGLELAPGDRSGLFLRREAGAWHSGLCEQFDPADASALAVPVRDDPGRLDPAPPIPDGGSGSSWTAAALIGGAGAVAVAAALVVRQRRPSVSSET